MELSIFGFLRNICDDKKEYDYTDIIKMILKFHKEGYAKYYDQNVDKDYKEKMVFGDILKTQDHKFQVLDINKDLLEIGEIDSDGDICILIPLSVCEHSIDAVTFYSKFDKISFFQEMDYTLILDVRHDD